MREKLLKKETLFQGYLFSVSREYIEFANGNQSTRDIVRHRPAVVILAVTDDKKLVFVEQFRRPAGQDLLELPAGGMDPEEAPLAAAQRELSEETGITATQWTRLFGGYAAPGFCDEFLHIYLAEELSYGASHPDEDEYVEIHYFTLDEVEQKIKDGSIQDLKTIAAVFYVKAMGVWDPR